MRNHKKKNIIGFREGKLNKESYMISHDTSSPMQRRVMSLNKTACIEGDDGLWLTPLSKLYVEGDAIRYLKFKKEKYGN